MPRGRGTGRPRGGGRGNRQQATFIPPPLRLVVNNDDGPSSSSPPSSAPSPPPSGLSATGPPSAHYYDPNEPMPGMNFTVDINGFLTLGMDNNTDNNKGSKEEQEEEDSGTDGGKGFIGTTSSSGAPPPPSTSSALPQQEVKVMSPSAPMAPSTPPHQGNCYGPISLASVTSTAVLPLPSSAPLTSEDKPAPIRRGKRSGGPGRGRGGGGNGRGRKRSVKSEREDNRGGGGFIIREARTGNFNNNNRDMDSFCDSSDDEELEEDETIEMAEVPGYEDTEVFNVGFLSRNDFIIHEITGERNYFRYHNSNFTHVLIEVEGHLFHC